MYNIIMSLIIGLGIGYLVGKYSTLYFIMKQYKQILADVDGKIVCDDEATYVKIDHGGIKDEVN